MFYCYLLFRIVRDLLNYLSVFNILDFTAAENITWVVVVFIEVLLADRILKNFDFDKMKVSYPILSGVLAVASLISYVLLAKCRIQGLPILNLCIIYCGFTKNKTQIQTNKEYYDIYK